jgi:septal ring factor EnvC (AmiA/AmiB activator)
MRGSEVRERSSSLLLRLIALVLCTGLCLDASAESSVESAKRYTKRLKLISKQLAVQSKRLSALDKRRRALNEELLRQEYALIDLELGRRQMARDREAINWEEERIARRIAQTELEIARTNVLIRERTRAYFIQNRLSPIERLLSDPTMQCSPPSS